MQFIRLLTNEREDGNATEPLHGGADRGCRQRSTRQGQGPRASAGRLGIVTETLYAWKHTYGGLEASAARRLRAFEEENRQLKRIVAEQALDNWVLKDLLAKTSDPRGPPEGGLPLPGAPGAFGAPPLRAGGHQPVERQV